jgi:putative oxidoreductase
MKIVTLIARVLLGLMFLVFGLNGFLHFIPMGPPPTGLASQYMGALAASHYLVFVFALQVVSGVLFLVGRYLPLALTLIGPVIVNILLFHALMEPSGIVPGLVATLLWIVVAYSVRSAFAGIFQKAAA